MSCMKALRMEVGCPLPEELYYTGRAASVPFGRPIYRKKDVSY